MVILVVALPCAGVMLYVWWQALQEGRALQTALLQASVAQLERDLTNLWNESEWVMSRTAARPAFRALSPKACGDEMTPLHELNPAFLAVTLWTTEGSLVCTSFGSPRGQPAPKANPARLEERLAKDALHLSNVFVGQIPRTPVVAFSYPVKDDAGQVAGVLSMPVRMSYFENLVLSVPRPEGSSAGIIDRNMVLVARVPANERWQGRSLADFPAVAAGLKALNGVITVPGVDGVERTFLYKKVPNTSWHVFVGVDSKILFSGFREQLVQGLAALAFVIAVSLILALALSRSVTGPLADLVRMADAVASGKRAARARPQGNDEIARVGQHLNRMLDVITRTEVALQDSDRRRHELSGRLIRAEEEERKRISRELHDQVGQDLTALAFDLKAMARRGGEGAELRRANEAVTRLLDQVRNITLLLRPPQLDDLGLLAALRGHIERHVSPHGIAVHFDAAINPGRLDPDLEAACFRLAQEALNNVLRHAQAANVWLNLRQSDGALVLHLRDDGAGFDLAAAWRNVTAGRSSGLSNMRDRAELAAGTLEIRSVPGQGTELLARFALQPRRGESPA